MARRADGTVPPAPRQNEAQMQGDVIRRRAVIHGRVQGVFFRDSLRRQARGDGVSGWARNLPDGTVEAVLEGPRESVQRILQFCETGPPHARVDGLDVTEETPEDLAGFEIR
jgi:acylphosphatase